MGRKDHTNLIRVEMYFLECVLMNDNILQITPC